jgi:hypothetical protein
MHVRRGLLRLWIVGSVAWIAYLAYDAISFKIFVCERPDTYNQGCDPGYITHLEWALGVPLGVLATWLVLWVAARWIIAGFRGR